MDEPTTHLDIHTVESLILALESYQGTLVFISNDVHFIRKLATKVLHVNNGQVRSYPGGYDYFLEKTGALGNERAAITADKFQVSCQGYHASGVLRVARVRAAIRTPLRRHPELAKGSLISLWHLTRGRTCKLGSIICHACEERQKIRGSSQAQNDRVGRGARARHVQDTLQA
ncbi:MAG: hypothetical protein WDN28_15825 [Chthoniobacter sp.]